jgi:hypothetical protein
VDHAEGPPRIGTVVGMSDTPIETTIPPWLTVNNAHAVAYYTAGLGAVGAVASRTTTAGSSLPSWEFARPLGSGG